MADVIDRPRNFVEVTDDDGFTVQSNTGTEEELRSDLGMAAAEKADGKKAAAQPAAAAAKTPDADDQPATPSKLPTKAKSRHDPRERRRSLQADIDAETERKRVAKEEADAEETRLADLRAQTARHAQPAARPAADAAATLPPQLRPQMPTQLQPPADARAKAPDYDGSDPNDPEPKIETFAGEADPYTAWLLAKQAHTSRVEWRKQDHTRARGEQRNRDEQTYHTRMSAYTAKTAEYAKADPEFQKKIHPAVANYLTFTTPDGPGVPLGDLVMDAPNTTELLIYFSTNQAELARISGLHPFQQAHEFGMIQGRLSAGKQPAAPRPQLVSKTKPPVPTVEGVAARSADNRSDDELSEEEHEAKYAKFRHSYR